MLGPWALIAAAILIFLGSCRSYLLESKLADSTITTQATVIDKELWAVYPVHYEISYSFTSVIPGLGKVTNYTGTVEVSRNFYNLLHLGDQIVVTYPTGDPHRSVLGPEFRNAVPWAFPLLGLSISMALFVVGRRQLLLQRRRQDLARRHHRGDQGEAAT